MDLLKIEFHLIEGGILMKRLFQPKLRQIGGALLLLVFCFTSLFAFAPKAEAASLGNHSQWAEAELHRAQQLDLSPGRLYGTDLTEPITREEYAGVMVNVIETAFDIEITDVKHKHPFVDTNDSEVIKAYNLKIIEGVGNGRFDPYGYLTREQAARMINSTYSALMNICSLAYNVIIPPFKDDALIADWADGDVYFMAQSNIIAGVGNHYFAPKGTLTREQALLLALRLYNNYPTLHKQDFVTKVDWY